jgi:hypothetical protein
VLHYGEDGTGLELIDLRGPLFNTIDDFNFTDLTEAAFSEAVAEVWED